MLELNLDDNEFSDDGAVYLSSCIGNIESLSLLRCSIGAKGVQALSQKIKGRTKRVKLVNKMMQLTYFYSKNSDI